MNTYGYVSGNPVKNLDRYGLAESDGATIYVPSPVYVPPSTTADGEDINYTWFPAGVGEFCDKLFCKFGMCSSDESDKDEPKCKFIGEVYYGGPEKTCRYQQKGAFGIITIRQCPHKPCPPIDPETCWVDTTGTPEEGRKPPKSPY